MKLKHVKICGFRSIEDMDLEFKGNGHNILVGKNESGKSNLLKALNLLSGEVGFEHEDKKELYTKPAFVRFLFAIEEDEIRDIKREFYKKFPFGAQTKLTKDLTIEEFFEAHGKYILYIIYHDKAGYWIHWAFNKSIQANGKWYSVDESIVDCGFGERILAESYINEKFIINNFNDEEQKVIKIHVSQIQIQDIHEFLRSQVKKYAAPDEYTFPVNYWKYSAKEHDLPSHTDRDSFAKNPQSCIPLKNMFLLSSIEKESINNTINDAKNKGPNHLKSLFDSINRETNKYIRKSWKEYNKVEIEIRADGENIAIGIQDSKNTFDFQQRSDGFRRLISFLLFISTEVNRGGIDKSLILIDEPETGLHPSSAKDLKDKLIEFGKTNTIVYATHSISMIDTENIENNLIVSRENENTIIEVAKEDGTSPAENVYQAIGHSIYEDLKQKNILLEGYTDKKVLSSFMIGAPWKHYGICYTNGVNNIKLVTSILDLASRKYFVLSDADKPATRKRRDMRSPSYWYTYKDLDSEAVTLEDFYVKDFFQQVAQEVFQKHKFLCLPDDWFQENDRIDSIKNFLHKKKEVEKEIDIKIIVDEIKECCIEKFTKKNVDREKIKQMLSKLLEKIEKGKNG